ncbi:hypothetical protein FRC10_002127 [Ceratobasidium sp. 414]|nr:hypothetical protein FRC10_002127 [Ceratobasidium sp. 414]
MASGDFAPLLTEFKSFLDRDPVDRHIPDLVELLERIFPTSNSHTLTRTPPAPSASFRDHNRTFDILVKSPEYVILTIVLQDLHATYPPAHSLLLPPNIHKKFPWIPKHSPMHPGSGHGHPDQAAPHNQSDANHNPAHPDVPSHSRADHARASYGRHEGAETQSDTPHPAIDCMSASVPFVNPGTSHPVLPSLSGHLFPADTPLTHPPVPPNAYSMTGPSGYTQPAADARAPPSSVPLPTSNPTYGNSSGGAPTPAALYPHQLCDPVVQSNFHNWLRPKCVLHLISYFSPVIGRSARSGHQSWLALATGAYSKRWLLRLPSAGCG